MAEHPRNVLERRMYEAKAKIRQQIDLLKAYDFSLKTGRQELDRFRTRNILKANEISRLIKWRREKINNGVLHEENDYQEIQFLLLNEYANEGNRNDYHQLLLEYWKELKQESIGRWERQSIVVWQGGAPGLRSQR